MDNQNFLLNDIIDIALEEDIRDGDISTMYIKPLHKDVKATMHVKAERGIISGMEIALMVFKKIDEDIKFNLLAKDGDKVKRGDIIIELEGKYSSLLTAERTALNFLQRMSGIATQTNLYVEKLKGTKVKLLDTRKTAPGMRYTDKMAVRHGGGYNHRMGLYDMVMLKDNHIKAAGGIENAVFAVRENIPLSVKIEVETSTLEQVSEAVKAEADIIMLDNMNNEMMAEAVKMINGKAKTEASGNMTIERLESVASTGVDFISVGALTHSVTALDISMNLF